MNHSQAFQTLHRDLHSSRLATSSWEPVKGSMHCPKNLSAHEQSRPSLVQCEYPEHAEAIVASMRTALRVIFDETDVSAQSSGLSIYQLQFTFSKHVTTKYRSVPLNVGRLSPVIFI